MKSDNPIEADIVGSKATRPKPLAGGGPTVLLIVTSIQTLEIIIKIRNKKVRRDR